MRDQKKSGALLAYINIFVKNGVYLFFTPALIYFLGQAQYGVYQMTNSVTLSLSVLSLGFASAYVRFYSQRKARKDDKAINELNGMYLLVFLAMTVVCLMAGTLLVFKTEELFAEGLTYQEIILAKQLMTILVVNIALTFPASVFDSYIMVHEKFVFQQSRQLFSNLASPLLAILLLVLGVGAVGVALAQTVVTLLLLIANIRYAIKFLKMRFSFANIQFQLLKEIGIFSFWIFLNQLFDLVNNNVPNFLLGAMESAKAVAIFSIAMQIRNIFINLSTALSNVFVPQINAMVAGSNDNTELTNIMTKVGRYQLIIFCYAFGGFIIVGEYFIKIWAGEGFSDVYLLAIIMIFPVLIPMIQNTGIEIQRAKNKHQARSLIYIGVAVLDIIISALLIPRVGYWGTAIGYIVSVILGTGIFMNWYYQYRIGLNMKLFWSKMLPGILVTAIIVIALSALKSFYPVTSILSFIIWILIYSAIFLPSIFRVVLDKNETLRILRLIHLKKN